MRRTDWERAEERTVGARGLRQRMTTAERVLWNALRGRQLDGLKFRRQHPFGPFVLDFCCTEARLAIEVDGSVHDEQVEQDMYRTEFVRSYGFRVLRFRNEEVLNDLETVLTRILEAARDRARLPLSRAPGEGPRVQAGG